ncbi:tyrosine-type recombinase/integrase [Paragemmobacter straminiformis]|uniref:Tyrosine-type recombinase/integrase n=1 Tax=Paragemmobacter straminiformis TaxID=2045119 RepID=A0A842I4V7_9RHOB|nr:tyrosine-type recombinase/integrase [Gemmobacter straminiformis]MBC2835162.1 tyrosine-type recombinase/integrase [Gemmobacter straminiformis]
MKPEQTIPHLELRPSGYFWRRRAPRKLGIQTSIFHLSLRTGDPMIAIPLALRLTELSSQLFEAAGSVEMNTSEIHALITETLAREVREADRLRALAPARTRNEALIEQAKLDALVASLKEAILLRDYSLVHDIMRAAARNLGLTPDEDSSEWRSAAHQTVRGLLDATKERIARDGGEFDEPSVFFRSARQQVRSESEVVFLASRPPVAPPVFASQSACFTASGATSNVQSAPVAGCFASAVPVAAAPIVTEIANLSAAPASSPEVADSDHETTSPPMEVQPATTAQSSECEVTQESDEGASQDVGSGTLDPWSYTSAFTNDPTINNRAAAAPTSIARTSETMAFGQSTSVVPANGEAFQAGVARAGHIPYRTRTPLLSEMSERYLAHLKAGYPFNRPAKGQVSTGEKTDKQLENAGATMRIFRAVMEDTEVGKITPDMCASFFEKLCKLPNTFCRSGTKMEELDSGQRSIDDIIAEADTEEAELKSLVEAHWKAEKLSEGNIRDAVFDVSIERLSANTIYRKMQELQRFFTFVYAEDHIAKNPMSNVIWTSAQLETKQKAEGDRSRKVWADDLIKLLRTPLFSSSLDDVGNPMFWSVMIALFTGMRLEETLQLRVGDFKTERGIWLVDVTDDFGRSLKNKAARRRIPLHSSLIELGLLKLVDLRRTQGEVCLFPHLAKGSRDTLGAAISKEFTEYRRKHDVYVKRKDFHSFRKSVNQRLIELNLSREIRYALLGHTNNDVNVKHYSDGFPIEQLKEGIEQIDFDISMVLKPFGTPEAGKVAQLFALTRAM